MALILLGEKKIRCDKIRPENKMYKLHQILKPKSMAVMQALAMQAVRNV